ncbi:MAG TPA: cyclopropane-fatty-acyl-phospholipid synthase family protein [Solirubrobacterales bacterium]|nr:cyclopropane-fatty-acyl-phospholipid synthase family protein [Solirubrobacterales bacterium]
MIARRILHGLLRRIESGRIELTETYPGGAHLCFGDPAAARRARLEIHSPAVYTRLARSKSIALGTTYAEGLWDSPDLLDLLLIVTREIGRADPLRRRIAPFLVPFQRLATLRTLNTRRRAREHISSHYDAGNDMFELFLDSENMMYSSAYFEHEGQGLEDAQLARLDRICALLELTPDDHLLEIGTGWGGMAIHAATTRGCRVTTTTISDEQRRYAERRVREAGLEDRVQVLGRDYRDLRGRYDKLVSVEMIEAVGWEWFDTYFRRCSRLLKPDGLFFLQAIVVDDAIYETEKRTRSFANELIFPGGCLPSVGAIQSSIASETDLRTLALEDISASYVRTLHEWRDRFVAATEELERLGYDEAFRRLWRLYMAMSEAGFTVGRIRDVQMLFAKPRYEPRLAPTPSAAALGLNS